MAGTQIQRRRGTTAEHSTFAGAVGELTVDTTKKTGVVHDGSTLGGFPLAREDLSNVSATLGFKNRIINGAMVIDQRNAGASVTIGAGDQPIVDRWFGSGSLTPKISFQQSTTSTTGFVNSLLITSLAATTPGSTDQYRLEQRIEGFNCADLAWGTASAVTVTLSFWVRCSLTGTFGGAIVNSAGNRSYPFSFTISSANTFEYKTITIPGDTTGTWLTNNGIGIGLRFSLGVGSTFQGTANTWAAANYIAPTGATNLVGTNGATLYITGVQLEKGSTATPFDYRSYGAELALCQRYYQQPIQNLSSGISQGGILTFYAINANEAILNNVLPVPMRTTPTVTTYGNTGTAGNAFNLGGGSEVATVTVDRISPYSIGRLTKTTGWSAGLLIACVYTASAEL